MYLKLGCKLFLSIKINAEYIYFNLWHEYMFVFALLALNAKYLSYVALFQFFKKGKHFGLSLMLCSPLNGDFYTFISIKLMTVIFYIHLLGIEHISIYIILTNINGLLHVKNPFRESSFLEN